MDSPRYPQHTGSRVIAGVFEDGFRYGWSPLIHGSPSFRILTPAGAACRLNGRYREQKVVLQIQLFGHIAHPPLPVLHVSCGSESWDWDIEPGWQVLCRSIRPHHDEIDVSFTVTNMEDEPWFELQVTEISVFEIGDPRIRRGNRGFS